MISIIVAISRNNIIGKDNKMPWHIKEDLQYFKEKTLGKTIIMGRRTFEGLPGKLKDRKYIVVSRNNIANVDSDIRVETDLQKLFDEYKNSEEVFIIGGRQIYEQALNICDKLYITHIDADFEGDTSFPHINYENFDLVSSKKIKPEGFDFEISFNEYKTK